MNNEQVMQLMADNGMHEGGMDNWVIDNAWVKFANLVAAQERDAIMKSIEELRPVEDNPLLQNKPAAFWIENFRQIFYTRGEA
jgi:hypothetical protein